MRIRRPLYIHLFPAAPRWRAFALGAVLGLLNGVLLVSGLGFSLIAGLILTALLSGLWWLTPRTRDTWSIHLFAMGHAILASVIGAIRWYRPPLSRSFELPAACSAILMVTFLVYCALFVLCLGLVLLFSLLRRRRIVQDGTLCPTCLYSLRGNRTGRCPECGHAFTPADLGLSHWPDA
jgi:hypothetical protein